MSITDWYLKARARHQLEIATLKVPEDLGEAARALAKAVRFSRTSPELEQQARWRLAEVLAALGRPAESVAELSRLTETDLADIQVWRLLAEQLDRLAQDQAAIQAWASVLARAADDPVARARLADLLIKTGAPRDALPHVQWLARHAEREIGPWRRLAELLEALGEVSHAADAWANIADLSSSAREKAIELLDTAGRRTDATEHVRALAEAAPDDPHAWRRLARRLEDLGQADDAVRPWRHLLELSPEDMEGHERLALLLVRLRREADALPHLEAHARAQPHRAKLWRRLAVAREAVGHWAAAVDAWEAAVGLEQDNIEARLRLVSLLRTAGPKLRLAEHLRALAERGSSPADHWRELAHLLANLGAAQAERQEPWRKLLIVDPGDLEAHEQLAAMLWKAGDALSALPHLEVVVTVRPPRAKTWKRLARCRREFGDSDGEIAALKQVIALDPEDQESRQRLANSLWAEGRRREAAPYLRGALRGGQPSLKELRRLGQALHETTDDETEQASSLSSVGEVFEEMAVWRQVLAKAPQDREAHLRLGELFWEMNRKTEAAPHLKVTAQHTPQTKVWRRLAACLKELGDLEGEQAALRQLVGLEGEDGPARQRLKELSATAAAEELQPLESEPEYPQAVEDL